MERERGSLARSATVSSLQRQSQDDGADTDASADHAVAAVSGGASASASSSAALLAARRRVLPSHKSSPKLLLQRHASFTAESTSPVLARKHSFASLKRLTATEGRGGDELVVAITSSDRHELLLSPARTSFRAGTTSADATPRIVSKENSLDQLQQRSTASAHATDASRRELAAALARGELPFTISSESDSDGGHDLSTTSSTSAPPTIWQAGV